jgi:hypothetical protein
LHEAADTKLGSLRLASQRRCTPLATDVRSDPFPKPAALPDVHRHHYAGEQLGSAAGRLVEGFADRMQQDYGIILQLTRSFPVWNKARTRMSERPKLTFLAEIAREELQKKGHCSYSDWHLLVSSVNQHRTGTPLAIGATTLIRRQ